MRKSLFLAMILFSSTLSGCLGEEDESEKESESQTEYWSEDEYTQPQTDLHFYSDGEKVLQIDSCPYIGNTPTVVERTVFQATHIRPYNGLNENLEYEIYEPSDISGKLVIVYVDWEEIVDDLAETFSLTKWPLFFQSKGAAGVIWAYTSTPGGDEFNSCSDYGEIKKITRTQSEQQQTSSDSLTIPTIRISGDDMRALIKLDSPMIEIGPDGFESIGISQTLPTKLTREWLPEYDSCAGGALQTIQHVDRNFDGQYSTDEQTAYFECYESNPLTDGKTQESVVYNTVSDSDCLSGKRYREDTIISYSNGTTETITGPLTECTGATVEDADSRLYQVLCGGFDSNYLTAEGFSLIDCIGSQIESELQRVTPQLKIDSLTSEQMPTCSNGGLRVIIWADGDGNNQWDSSETQSVEKICNGVDGADGSSGVDGQDGQDGLDGLPLLTYQLDAGSETCPTLAGGTEVYLGRDINRNGVLDDNEVEHSYAACNGQSGSDGYSSLIEVNDYTNPDCNGVYVRISSGLDVDNDTSLSIDETNGARYVCLPSQQTNTNSTFVKEVINPNSDCLNGGVHSYIWLDENGDNTMTQDEIFMESFDCADDTVVVECNDSDGDCISDEDDSNPDEDERQKSGDSDRDGVFDEEEDPNCIGFDDRLDSDGDGVPDCAEDEF